MLWLQPKKYLCHTAISIVILIVVDTCKCGECAGTPMIKHDISIYVDHLFALLVFSLISTFTSVLTAVVFSSLHCLSNVDCNRKGISWSWRHRYTYSCRDDISSYTCLTTPSAQPINDMPLFSILPLPTKSSLCSQCTISTLIKQPPDFYSVPNVEKKNLIVTPRYLWRKLR